MDGQRSNYTVRPEFDGLKKKPYVTIPIEVVDTFLNLPSESDIATALWAYVKYVLFGVEEIPEPLSIAWPLLKDKADRALEGIRNVKKRSDRGATVAPTHGPTLAPSPLNHNHNHNHNPSHNQREASSGKPDSAPILCGDSETGGNDAEKKRKRFAKPSFAEVSEYVAAQGYKVDPERFIDYYESNGWKVGRNPMKDWKAAVRNWARNDSQPSEAVKRNDYSQYDC